MGMRMGRSYKIGNGIGKVWDWLLRNGKEGECQSMGIRMGISSGNNIGMGMSRNRKWEWERMGIIAREWEGTGISKTVSGHLCWKVMIIGNAVVSVRCVQDHVYHRHHVLPVRRTALWTHVRVVVVQHSQGRSSLPIVLTVLILILHSYYYVPGSRMGHCCKLIKTRCAKIYVSFTVFYCTSCIALFSFFYLYCLSVCLYVSCLCLWAMLPDLNKMMMMMMITVVPR